MLGSRDWISGTNGHSFFRAELGICLKAVTTCPQSVSLTFCFQGAAAHLADYSVKLSSLERIGLLNSPFPFRESRKRVRQIIEASPVLHSKYVHERAEALHFKDLIARAPIGMKVHKVAYYMFLDSIHPSGATYYTDLGIFINSAGVILSYRVDTCHT